MQTDDILILADQSFAVAEEEAVHSVKIIVGSPLLRGWYGSQSTSSEHALNTIVVN